jgi:hypothetical protein
LLDDIPTFLDEKPIKSIRPWCIVVWEILHYKKISSKLKSSSKLGKSCAWREDERLYEIPENLLTPSLFLHSSHKMPAF